MSSVDEPSYGPWEFSITCRRPTIGSRWYRGNFTLGLLIDIHPRFVNFVFGFLLFEIVVGWNRD